MLSFYHSRKLNPEEKKLFNRIYNLTGVRAKNISLYQQALRHRSVAVPIKEGVKNSNERLEFLGDAALGLIVAEYLYKIYPFREEGFLTQMRSKIVNRTNLNQIALKIGLDELITFDLKGDRRHNSIYGDAFEALIGAIYLDQGFIKAKEFFIEKIIKIHLDILEIEKTELDFKSKLLNWGQQNKKKIEFVVEKEFGPSHNKKFIVRVFIDDKPYHQVESNSKRKAEQVSAELTYMELGIKN